jgi:hypothetical protein
MMAKTSNLPRLVSPAIAMCPSQPVHDICYIMLSNRAIDSDSEDKKEKGQGHSAAEDERIFEVSASVSS